MVFGTVQVISSPASIMIALAHSSEKVLTKDPPIHQAEAELPQLLPKNLHYRLLEFVDCL
jgi:hypothetical protein